MSNYEPGKYITIFTDASFCHKTKSAGYACWIKFGVNGETERFSGHDNKLRNSMEAEYHAMKIALIYVNNFIDHQNKVITVQSDCVPALDKLRVRVNDYIDGDYSHISFKHVRGHQNSFNARSAVNEWCDGEARRKMRELRGW